MKVAIVHDSVSSASSPDQADVLVQAETVSAALSALEYEPVTVNLPRDVTHLIHTLNMIRPKFVFNLVESVHGRGQFIHLIPSLLDYLGTPYTGSKAEALLTSSSKLITKRILASAAILTPAAWQLNSLKGKTESFQSGIYIAKAVWEHASVGIEDDAVLDVKSAEHAAEVLSKREKQFATAYFIEKYIEGREFNISLLASTGGVDVLPPAEIVFHDFPPTKRKIVGYRAKWDEESFEYQHTLRCFDFPAQDAGLLAEIKQIATTCWDLFELSGYARVDVRVDQTGLPWVLEVNANPCLSPDAGFFAAAQRAGLTVNDVIQRIVDNRVLPPVPA